MIHRQCLVVILAIIVIKSISMEEHSADLKEEVLEDEDIKNTWQKKFLEMCLNAEKYFPGVEKQLFCVRKRIGYEFVNLEVLNEKPAILRLVRFLEEPELTKVNRRLKTSSEMVSQGVEGLNYSPGHRGRKADGVWVEHDDESIRPLYNRIQNILRINPAIAEDFLVLKYKPMGHYAPHYDHLQPMPVEYDGGWFVYFGNRLATALLLVETAQDGGYTVFPYLNLTIQPEKGDLLLWFNADSNDLLEEDSLHAACPIQRGVKIAISLWIRGNFQNGLKCSPRHPGYDPLMLIREDYPTEKYFLSEALKERPTIPKWVID